MKLFQKDIDEQLSATQSTKLLNLQINYCFENLLHEFQQLIKNFDKKRFDFLQDIIVHFKVLQELNSSNIMKLDSVKNYLSESYQKMFAIETYCSKFTQYDLTDKKLRKQYEQKYQKLRDRLSDDRKALIYLTTQFQNPITLNTLFKIDDPSPEKVEELVEKSKMLLRVLYNLQKFPQLEQEYNEKSTKSYLTCKHASELIDSLKDFFNNKALLSAERYREGEEVLRNLGNLNVKVIALNNELNMIANLATFKNLINKPLMATTKLINRMEVSEKNLKDILTNIKETLVSEYSELISSCESVENQLSSHVKRLLNTSQHLDFSNWKVNYSTVENTKTEMLRVINAVNHFANEKYPPSITLVPKPSEKKEQLALFEKRAECLKKTLKVGEILEPDAIAFYLSDLTTQNIREKLKPLNLIVQE